MSADSAISFDDQVAVVTGAGRGIGRAIALDLAARGAAVVVNDIGVASAGSGQEGKTASRVAAEIDQFGGRAVADWTSVVESGGPASIVNRALDEFGRVDVLVNNAGIRGQDRSLEDTQLEDVRSQMEIHYIAALEMTRAVWSAMREQGGGRVVNVGSGSMFGYPTMVPYSAAKAAQFGLTRAAAAAGEPLGIHVNSILPTAQSALVSELFDDGASHLAETSAWTGPWMRELATPEQVAPVVSWLAHDECPANGEVFSAGAGRVSRVFLGDTEGIVQRGLTAETVRELFDEICRTSSFAVHADAPARFRDLYERTLHLMKGRAADDPSR